MKSVVNSVNSSTTPYVVFLFFNGVSRQKLKILFPVRISQIPFDRDFLHGPLEGVGHRPYAQSGEVSAGDEVVSMALSWHAFTLWVCRDGHWMRWCMRP